jgi:hypothetical protein
MFVWLYPWKHKMFLINQNRKKSRLCVPINWLVWTKQKFIWLKSPKRNLVFDSLRSIRSIAGCGECYQWCDLDCVFAIGVKWWRKVLIVFLTWFNWFSGIAQTFWRRIQSLRTLSRKYFGKVNNFTTSEVKNGQMQTNYLLVKLT